MFTIPKFRFDTPRSDYRTPPTTKENTVKYYNDQIEQLTKEIADLEAGLTPEIQRRKDRLAEMETAKKEMEATEAHEALGILTLEEVAKNTTATPEERTEAARILLDRD